MPFGLQPIHLLVIVVVALLIFGPRRLPKIGRWIARTFAEFRKGARDMAEGFRQEAASQEQASAPTGSEGAPESAASRAQPGTPPRAQPGAAASPYPEASAGSRYCTSCGAQNAPDARFCNKCGTRMPA